jgi:Kef-type K+ transport system membrane component KefB
MRRRTMAWVWLGSFVALLLLTRSLAEALIVGGIMAALATAVVAAIDRD